MPYDPSDPPLIGAFERAESALCQGEYSTARDGFASILPSMHKYMTSNGRFLPDTERGYLYSLIATADDSKADNFLEAIKASEHWQPSHADRLFWKGATQGAFAAYETEIGALSQYPDGAIYTAQVIKKAVQANDVSAAVTILSSPLEAQGVSDVGSLALLMLGDAYASERRWPEAFGAWVRAANHGHQVPESDYLDRWNMAALQMIYYYRAHAPADART